MSTRADTLSKKPERAPLLKTALAIYLGLGIGLFLLGLLYLFLNEFMHYHAQALQAEWSELSANYRGFIIGLLRALGAGAAVSGLAIAWMAVASWRGTVEPYRALLPMISIGYSGLLCWATWTVSSRTPGEPPLLLNLAAVGAAVVASILLVIDERRHRVAQD